MATGWHLSGDYFENCNCDVVCPCLVSTNAPLTSNPTQGVCDVALFFHIDSGNYGDVQLNGLNVALIAHTPGPFGAGNWTTAAYRRTRRRQTNGSAGRHLHWRRRRSNGGICAVNRQQSRSQEGTDQIPDRRQEAVGGNPQYFENGGRAAADHARERGDVGVNRPSGQSGQTCARHGDARQYVQRPRHALGQFR